jgi:ATP-dependent protease HslVU (ClpYQ), ATPase subunit
MKNEVLPKNKKMIGPTGVEKQRYLDDFQNC